MNVLPRAREFVRRNLATTLGILIGSGLGGFAWLATYNNTLSYWSYDLPFSFREIRTPKHAALVYMDDTSKEVLAQNKAVWDRVYHAELIRRLSEAGAKAVVFDILFIEDTDKEGTEYFAETMREFSNVILGSDAEVATASGASITAIAQPLPPMLESSSGTGSVSLFQDSDLSVREIHPGHYNDERFFPSLAWIAASRASAEITKDPRQQARFRWNNYYGPAGTFRSLSYYLVLEEDGFPEDFFRDRVVFVGASAESIGYLGESREAYRNPYTWLGGSYSSGVELHATAFENLMDQTWLERMDSRIEFPLVLLFGGLFGWIIVRLHPIKGLLVAIAVAGGLMLISYQLAWHYRIWYTWLVPVVVQIPSTYLWSVLHNYGLTFIEKQRYAFSLSMHLSPARAKQLMDHPELLKPGAEKQEVSIMFTDIADFSKISARIQPDDLFESLNNYFENALDCVHATDGTLVKLIGDAMFAIWNAPQQQSDHHLRTAKAALLLHDRLKPFTVASGTRPAFCTRIGLHTGLAHVGNVGSRTRVDYTAIGDNINLASRLEGLNKYLCTEILASRDLQRMIEHEVSTRFTGYFNLKGTERITEVYELLNTEQVALDKRTAWVQTFHDAHKAYRDRQLKHAKTLFENVLEIKPNDGPSRYYLNRLTHLEKTPPSPDWHGEEVLDDK